MYACRGKKFILFFFISSLLFSIILFCLMVFLNKNENQILGEQDWQEAFVEASLGSKYCIQHVENISFFERLINYFDFKDIKNCKSFLKEWEGGRIYKWDRKILIMNHPVRQINRYINKFIEDIKDYYPYEIILTNKNIWRDGSDDSDVVINYMVPYEYFKYYEKYNNYYLHKVICGRSVNCIWDLSYIDMEENLSRNYFLHKYIISGKGEYIKNFYIPFGAGFGYQVDGYFIIDENNKIKKAECLIPLYYGDHIKFDDASIQGMVSECLMHALGFPSTISRDYISVLAERRGILSFGYLPSITELDKKFLFELYKPNIKSGFKKDELIYNLDLNKNKGEVK